MSILVRAISLCVSATVILYILRTIRTRRIREEYIVLWLATAFCIMVVVFFDNLSVWLANIIGAQNDVVMIMFFAFAYILAVLVHYSLRISELMHSIKVLNQEIGLLKNRIEEMEKSSKDK